MCSVGVWVVLCYFTNDFIVQRVDNLATYYFKHITVGESPTTPAALNLARHVAGRPGVFPEILKSLFEIVLFEECGNQWSLSRPMLSLILISEEYLDLSYKTSNKSFLETNANGGDEAETEEEQAAFMKELETFHKVRCLEFKPPRFYGEPLNCLKLWRAVIRLGGPGPDSIGIVAISHGCTGVAARACGLVGLEPTRVAKILKDQPSWYRDCRAVDVLNVLPTANGGTIELLYMQSL
ncbi:unnamed protein product [Camellia sinensis]